MGKEEEKVWAPLPLSLSLSLSLSVDLSVYYVARSFVVRSLLYVHLRGGGVAACVRPEIVSRFDGRSVSVRGSGCASTITTLLQIHHSSSYAQLELRYINDLAYIRGS